MKLGLTAVWIAGALTIAAPTLADPVRQNVIWARTTASTITLDGVLSEPAWATAESRLVRFGRGIDNGLPGSGYQFEAGLIPKDSVVATFKFLVNGNQLYMAATVSDSSVGGSSEFNRIDGLLMSIKDHTSLGHPAPPAEYLYSWWYQDPDGPDPPAVPNPTARGLPPTFGGRWATPPWGSARTAEQIAAWDAVTVLNGVSNSDTTADHGYTVEMRFDLTPMGYDVTAPSGDIVEWNVSIYDCDWFWPFVANKFSANRTWWQSPWGNAMWYDEVRIFSRPDVTTASGPVPAVGPEVRIPNGASFPTPAIDGQLSEAVWANAPSLPIKYGGDAERATYGNPLKWRAGQYQPPVNAGVAAVSNAGDAKVKWFFKNDSLFLGFDVNDESVTSIPVVDRWDGFIVSINDRVLRSNDNVLKSRRLAFRVGPAGQVKTEDWTDSLLVQPLGGRIALALKPNTTVDSTGLDFDEGYTAEFMINLRKFGYPAGLGDGALFIGIDYFDGDCFTPFTKSYGTRTWWGREYEDQCCPGSAFLDPSVFVTDVGDAPHSTRFALIGNSPNPALDRTLIRFVMPVASRVTLEVFDLAGRRVASQRFGLMGAGQREAALARGTLPPGLYAYRLKLADPVSGLVRADLAGKLMFLK